MDPSNFVFPNDLHVHWSMMIALYPYITGIVAGAFIVSSLYHVFKVEVLKPISRFSLLFALAFLAFATLPLLLHLGRPERNFNIMLTPSASSAMAGFGYIYTLYGIVLLLEILFIYRPTLIELKHQTSGLMKLIYTLLTFASDDTSQRSLDLDHKIIKVLAAVGIPMACVLHGYVGFIFGGVKANPNWSTPLMPVIFLLSACVSGIAGIILVYVLIKTFTRKPIDMACLRTTTNYLAGFFIIDFTFEMLEVFSHSYLRTWYHHSMEGLLWGPLFSSFWVWQVLILSVVPMFILGYLCLTQVRDRIYLILAPLVSVMLMMQVMFMRWNVVIGGQLMSKSHRGYTVFHPEWIDREGILAVLIVMSLPIILLFILSKIFPFWLDDEGESAG
ncbi:oxidoreductase, membrane subunit [Olavius sp. associated proteobacterium Delta 1]|nr:oxidoreductase, membrane subunit [Olavius sp. associated proteobacterium Delta 1]